MGKGARRVILLEELARKDLEYRYYAEALSSIESGEKDKGVWAKAFADAGGDSDKAQAKYIELIVEKMMLATEAEDEIDANLAKEKEEELRKQKEDIEKSLGGGLQPSSGKALWLLTILSFLFLFVIIGLA